MKQKISRLQYFLLIPNLLFGKAIGITAGVMARQIGSDTWTSMLIGFVIGIFLVVGMVYICGKFPAKTMVEFSEEIFGKLIGKAIGIILFLFFTIAFSVSSNVMTLHIKEYFLVETPMFIICLIYTLLCMYGVFLGVEVVVRFAMLGLLMSIAIHVTMITGTYKDFRINNILPLFDTGILNNLMCSIYTFSDIAMVVLTIGFLYPLLNKKKNVFKISIGAMLLAIFMIIPWPLFEVGVMGAEVMKHYVIVCMQQIRCAQLTRYLPRYELIMVSFFMFGMFVQSVTIFYCSVYSLQETIGIKKNWFIIVPLAVVSLFVTYIMSYDHNHYIDFLSFPWSQICAAISIGLPLLIFITALARGKLKNKKMNIDR